MRGFRWDTSFLSSVFSVWNRSGDLMTHRLGAGVPKDSWEWGLGGTGSRQATPLSWVPGCGQRAGAGLLPTSSPIKAHMGMMPPEELILVHEVSKLVTSLPAQASHCPVAKSLPRGAMVGDARSWLPLAAAPTSWTNLEPQERVWSHTARHFSWAGHAGSLDWHF